MGTGRFGHQRQPAIAGSVTTELYRPRPRAKLFGATSVRRPVRWEVDVRRARTSCSKTLYARRLARQRGIRGQYRSELHRERDRIYPQSSRRGSGTSAIALQESVDRVVDRRILRRSGALVTNPRRRSRAATRSRFGSSSRRWCSDDEDVRRERRTNVAVVFETESRDGIHPKTRSGSTASGASPATTGCPSS